MDVIASPIITVILNLVANILVAKGILDSHSAVAFVQFGNNAVAGLMTFGIGFYSIYKMIELKKHQISANTVTVSTPISQQFSQANATVSTGQSGIPPTPVVTTGNTQPIA